MTTRATRLRTASRERRERQRDDLRHTILTAAALLFNEKGYEGFSLRQVAEQIGYSPAAIYLHFRDKDDLLFAVVDAGFEQFLAALVEAAADMADPVKRIAALGRAYVRWGVTNPEHYRLMFMQRSDFLAGCRDQETAPRIASFQMLRDAVQAGLDQGGLRADDSDAIATTLWALVHGVVAVQIALPEIVAGQAEAMTDLALEMAERGLRPD